MSVECSTTAESPVRSSFPSRLIAAKVWKVSEFFTFSIPSALPPAGSVTTAERGVET